MPIGLHTRAVFDWFKGVNYFAEGYFHTQAANFTAEAIEGCGSSPRGNWVALHHIGIRLMAALDVIGFNGHHLVQNVGGAIGLNGPDFHLAHALTAMVGLPTHTLLRHRCACAS